MFPSPDFLVPWTWNSRKLQDFQNLALLKRISSGPRQRFRFEKRLILVDNVCAANNDRGPELQPYAAEVAA